ncbi:MAG: hypothetical protein WAW88_05465 [Nocardioides sp.]
MAPIVFALGMLALLEAAIILYLYNRLGVTARRTPAELMAGRNEADNIALRALVDDLKQTAWDHRELDSNLATIIIDDIRAFERGQRPDAP